MAPTPTSQELFEVIITLVWACLMVPTTRNNRLFALVFFDKSIVANVAASASLSFCPGLLEVIQAASPPTLSWWKALPDNHHGRWGVYALVFEKKGCRPLIYIGSGSESLTGLTSRWALYDRHNLYLRQSTNGLPSQVIWAFQNGYKITHKGLLVSAPIPVASRIPHVRLLCYAMEATFSFLFWTMKSTTKGYGMSSCCPWPMDAFTYGGLCTHSALRDTVKGNFGLTAKQIETVSAEAVVLRAAIKKAAYEKLKIDDPEELRATQRRANHKYYRNPHGKHQAKVKRRTAKVKAEHPFYCEVCEVDCEKPSHFIRHNATPRHIKEVADFNAGIVKRYRCDPCGKKFPYPSCIVKHNRCARHKANMAALSTT